MTIFGKRDDKQPKDPPKGTPPDGNPPADPPPPEYVTKEEFTKLQDTLNQINLRFDSFGQPSNRPADPPPDDAAKKQDERLAQITKEIDEITSKIDEAVYEGKGVGKLISARDKLNDERYGIERQRDLAQIQNVGFSTLDQLSEAITIKEMPHLSIPEVKASYDKMIQSMNPSLRMQPANRQAAYKFAVGENIEKVTEIATQAALRSDTQDPPDTPSGKTRGSHAPSGGNPDIPDPRDVLSQANLDALRAVGKTPEQYYQSLGYKGWEDYYEKNRSYYEGEKEEE